MGKLVIISGPSGVGKGTIIKLLQEKYQEKKKKLYLSISCTTRLPREGEVNGVDYYFIKKHEFLKKIKEGDFFEFNKYGTGKYYGTPKSIVIDYLQKGYDVLLEIDINGYKQIKEQYPDAIGIFIMPPSIDSLYDRLNNRATETSDAIKTRVETAINEINEAKETGIYDYMIKNLKGKSNEAMEEIYSIING